MHVLRFFEFVTKFLGGKLTCERVSLVGYPRAVRDCQKLLMELEPLNSHLFGNSDSSTESYEDLFQDTNDHNYLKSGKLKFSNGNSHEFFLCLKELPNDIKRYIIMLMMGKSALGCFDYSCNLISDNTLSPPVLYNPNGKSVLVTCFPKNMFGISITNNTDALLFDLSSGNSILKVKGKNKIEGMAFSKNGLFIVIITGKDIRVLDAATGNLVLEINEFLGESGKPTAISPDGSKVIIERTSIDLRGSEGVGENDQFFLINLDLENLSLLDYENDNFQLSEKINLDMNNLNEAILNFHFASNGLIIVNTSGFFPVILNAMTGKQKKVEPDQQFFYTIISRDNRKFASYKPDQITILDESFEELRVIGCEREWATRGGSFVSLEFSPDSTIIVAYYLCFDEFDLKFPIIHVWDVNSGKKLYSKRGFRHPKFNLNGNFMFAMSNDRFQICFWHSRTGTILKTLRFTSPVNVNHIALPHIVTSPYDNNFYLGIYTKDSQVVSCKNLGKSILSNQEFGDKNRLDPWQFFKKLYPLFYIEEKKQKLDKFSLNSFYGQGDSFINFSEFFSINVEEGVVTSDSVEVPEKTCFETFMYYFGLIILFAMFLPFLCIFVVFQLLSYPLVYLFRLIFGSLCETRAD